jgi:hypothetical protein
MFLPLTPKSLTWCPSLVRCKSPWIPVGSQHPFSWGEYSIDTAWAFLSHTRQHEKSREECTSDFHYQPPQSFSLRTIGNLKGSYVNSERTTCTQHCFKGLLHIHVLTSLYTYIYTHRTIIISTAILHTIYGVLRKRSYGPHVHFKGTALCAQHQHTMTFCRGKTLCWELRANYRHIIHIYSSLSVNLRMHRS